MYNCMLVDYQTMLNNRFILGNAVIESPKSIKVTATLLTQIIQGVASSQYGGQTINRMDEGLAKFVTISYIKLLKSNLYKLLSIYLPDMNENEEEKFKNEINNIIDNIPKNDIKGINIYIENNNTFSEVIRNLISNFNTENNKISYETLYVIIKKLINITMKDIDKEVYDAMQCIEYQINTIYSTNG